MDEISIDDAFQNKRDQNKERINTTIRDYAAIDWTGRIYERELTPSFNFILEINLKVFLLIFSIRIFFSNPIYRPMFPYHKNNHKINQPINLISKNVNLHVNLCRGYIFLIKYIAKIIT